LEVRIYQTFWLAFRSISALKIPQTLHQSAA
jgi:hypothetical protein